MIHKKRAYLAGPFFNEEQKKLISDIEAIFNKQDIRSDCELYSPSRDGGVLSKDSTSVEIASTFRDNVTSINDCDFMVVVYDYNDMGTQFEVGYATSIRNSATLTGYIEQKPIIGLCRQDSMLRFANSPSILSSDPTLNNIVNNLEDLENAIRTEIGTARYKFRTMVMTSFPENVDSNFYNMYKTVIADNIGNYSFSIGERLPITRIQNEYNLNFGKIIETSCIHIALIDDRDPFVMSNIGIAYRLGIPTVTFSNQNYGLNVMISESVVGHTKQYVDIFNLIANISRFGLRGRIPLLEEFGNLFKYTGPIH